VHQDYCAVWTLKAAALKLGFVTEQEFDRVVDPAKMVRPYVTKAIDAAKANVSAR
jgi:fumarate hydratase, class II